MIKFRHRAREITGRGAYMAGRYREYNPEQSYFTVIDPKEIKEHNPLLAAIDSFVEEHVSIEPFSDKLNNEGGGAPAVHPRMMLKVLFYSYAHGIRSSRQMEEHLRWDPNYMYLSGNQRVDHSTLCEFIIEYGHQIKDIFSRLLYVMVNLGYVSMDFVAVDGTKIRANASKKFTGNIREFKEKRKRIEKKIEEILHHTTEEGQRYKKRKIDKLNFLHREHERIEAFLGAIEDQEDIGDRKVSLSDKDACMVKDGDSKYMGYNCQVGVDEKAGVIVGAEVFNEANERRLMKPMVEEIRERAGDALEGTELGHDAGYFSSDNLQYAHSEKLKIYLPEGRGEGGVKKRKGEEIEARDCKMEIDEKGVRLICPGGQVMEVGGERKKYGYHFYLFRPKRKQCHGCRDRERCYKHIHTRKGFTVKKEYFEALPLREEMRQRLSSPKGKQRMADRSCIVEHIFGEIKEHYKFRRFMHRGLEKVRFIWKMVCMAYNFRKLARLAYA